jgi:hypothetical protein
MAYELKHAHCVATKHSRVIFFLLAIRVNISTRDIVAANRVSTGLLRIASTATVKNIARVEVRIIALVGVLFRNTVF